MSNNIIFRNLECDDYCKNYFDLLSDLTPFAEKCLKMEFDNFVNNLSYNHVVIVCEMEGIIIATGTLFIEHKLIRNCGLVGHIEDIVVSKNISGNGIGKKLINELIELAKEKKCYKVILDCKKEIIPFYEKCGFNKKEEQMALYF